MSFTDALKAYYEAHTAYLERKRELFGLTLWRPYMAGPERVLVCPVCEGSQKVVVKFHGVDTQMPCPIQNQGEYRLFTPSVSSVNPSDSMLEALPWGGPGGLGISESREDALAHAEATQKRLLQQIEADIRRYFPGWKMPEFKDWPIYEPKP